MHKETAGEVILRKCREHWPPISKSRLARRLDIDPTQFSRILTGDRKAPDGMNEKIAAILGCDVSEITSTEPAAA